MMFLTTVCAVAVAIAPAAQQRSSALDALLQAAVDQKRVPMTVAMVADGKGVVYEHAVGAPKEAIFAIASMTKPITSVAVMQLVEAGRVKLDAPAATYVKELADVQVLDGGALRASKTPITVRQLLTHTSGFGYEFLNRDLLALVGKKQIPSVMAGGAGFLKAPLVSDPGTRWDTGSARIGSGSWSSGSVGSRSTPTLPPRSPIHSACATRFSTCQPTNARV